MVYTAITTAGKDNKVKCHVIRSTFDYRDALDQAQCDYPTEKMVALVRGDHGNSTYCVTGHDFKVSGRV